MSTNDLSKTRPADPRGVCVVIAGEDDEALRRSLDSVLTHTPAGVPVERVAASAPAVNEALERLAPADVAILTEPCLVADGWLESLAAAAR
jgi:hypothetical protein